MNQKEESLKILNLKELILLEENSRVSSEIIQEETSKQIHTFNLFQIDHHLSSEFKIVDLSSYNLTLKQKNLKIGRLKNAYFKSFGVDPNNLLQTQNLKIFLNSVPKTKELVTFLFDEQDSHVEELNKKEDQLFDLFKDQINIYGYFKEEEYESFKKIYKVLQYVAQVVENNDHGDEVAQRAYKLMVLFGKEPEQGLKNLDTFIKKFAAHLQKPVHDILIHDIPKQEEKIDFPAWQKLLNRYGWKLLKNLVLAKEIEQALGGRAPKNFQEINYVLPQLIYQRSKENPDLAQLFHHYGVPESAFDLTLDSIKNGTLNIKTSDRLPSVIVELEKEVNPDYKGYYLVKLPAGDPRGLILGYITHCCQNIDGNSKQCVMDGMTLQSNGFYVLIKVSDKNFDPNNIDWVHFEEHENQVRGQGYIWISKEGSITIDSWENLGPSDDEKIIKSLPVLAQKMLEADSSISRVTIGLGGNTPTECKKIFETHYPEEPFEGFIYGDSNKQVEVEANEILQEYRIKYDWMSECLVSIKQIKVIEQLSEKKIQLLKNLEKDVRKEWLHPTILGNSVLLNTLLNLIEENKEDIRVSRESIHLYSTGKVSIEIFDIQDPEIVKLLISPDAMNVYKGGVSIQDLNNIKDPEIIKLLISWNARILYRAGRVSIQDLKNIKDSEIIKLLISPDAMNVYKVGVSIQDLNNIKDPEIIKLLISPDAMNAYGSRGVSVKDLNDIKDPEIIKLLISWKARNVYGSRRVSVKDLNDIKDPKVLKLLISNRAGYAYSVGKISVKDLNDIKDPEIIKLLISEDAIKAYKEKILVKDLKNIKDPEIIKLLISPDAMNAYKGEVSIQDLNNIKDPEIIKLLISDKSCFSYKGETFSMNANLNDKHRKQVLFSLNNKLLNELEIKSIQNLSRNIGENLFGKINQSNVDDIVRIEMSLLESISDIKQKTEEGTLNINNLKPGHATWNGFRSGYDLRNQKPLFETEGLTKLFYDHSKYNKLSGFFTGKDIHFPENSLTSKFKEKLKEFIKKVILVDSIQHQKEFEIDPKDDKTRGTFGMTN